MVSKAGHVVHIVGERTPILLRALCGSVKGKAYDGNPNTVTWLLDHWCTRCFKRFEAKEAV